MIPSRLFRSRWSALFWAAGILWTAYDVAMASRPEPPTNTSAPADRDATGEAVNPADLAILANAAG
ncbi:hypothetical protein [Sphingomonas bacterium]|uniref:hypothetical protein n=1 Tax=Sphingomonas bacterium TaxID=1895847 RepID=UPI00157749F1|nr:hypothetical protein [Sphingomonas bacterium]